MDLKNDDAGFFPSPQTQFEICGPKKCFFLNLGLFFFSNLRSSCYIFGVSQDVSPEFTHETKPASLPQKNQRLESMNPFLLGFCAYFQGAKMLLRSVT